MLQEETEALSPRACKELNPGNNYALESGSFSPSLEMTAAPANRP